MVEVSRQLCRLEILADRDHAYSRHKHDAGVGIEHLLVTKLVSPKVVAVVVAIATRPFYEIGSELFRAIDGWVVINPHRNDFGMDQMVGAGGANLAKLPGPSSTYELNHRVTGVKLQDLPCLNRDLAPKRNQRLG